MFQLQFNNKCWRNSYKNVTTHCAKDAAQNSYTNLSAINSQKLCSLHSQLAKAAKKRTSKKHIICFDATKDVYGAGKAYRHDVF